MPRIEFTHEDGRTTYHLCGYAVKTEDKNQAMKIKSRTIARKIAAISTKLDMTVIKFDILK